MPEQVSVPEQGGVTGPVDPRVALVIDDLRRRLRAVCRDWEAAEFEGVIERIARMKVRWTDGGYGD